MKIISAILFGLLLCGTASAQQQTYTNTKQNFTMTLPGTPDPHDEASEFYLTAANSDSTFLVSVDALAEKRAPGRATVADYVSKVEGVSGCKDDVYGDDPTTLCDYNFINDSGVHVHGKAWFVNHGGWFYAVVAMASVNGGHDNYTELMAPINSFSFLH